VAAALYLGFLFFPLQVEAEKGAIEVNKSTTAKKAKIGD